MVLFSWAFLLLPVSMGSNGWDLVREIIDEQPVWDNVAVSVGRSGREFVHLKGNITMDQKIKIASASKMVSGIMILKLIEKGVVGLDDLVSKYIPYWSTNDSDTRSRIKIKHALSFTDGYTFGLTASDECQPITLNFASCVKQLYDRLPHDNEPGTMWDYNEFHLQIIGAVLENVTGLTIDVITRRHLDELGMKNSSYLQPKNPDLSGSLVSTGNDYEQFMIQYFNNKIIGADMKSVVEQDWTPYPAIGVSNGSEFIQVFMGHYCLANFYECPFLIGRGYPVFPPECTENKIHSDPGLFGWLPLYDEKIGYWMQIAAFKPLGAIRTAILRYVLKPFVDAAITGKQINTPDPQYYANLLPQVESWSQNQLLVRSLQKMAPISWNKS